MKPMIRDIQVATARQFKVPMRTMTSPNKFDGSGPRQVAMFLAREITGKSYKLIAGRFNRKNHTTIRHAFYKVARLTKTDTVLASKVQAIREEMAA